MSTALLRACFDRPGYVRAANLTRRKEVGSERYKKGWEVRLLARDTRELAEVRRALAAAGFRPGRPFKKHKQIVQPVYGKAAVEAFLRFQNASRRKQGTA
ncbi:MAG TPA: hypothetical protein VNJ71_06785 [Gemmatimonadales bacterium]|nr:hypothetical protein [Gemmatimonadales bacterium]